MTRKEYERLAARRDDASAEFHAAWAAVKSTPEYATAVALRADWFEANMEASAAHHKLPFAVLARMENEKHAAEILYNTTTREMDGRA